MSGDFASWLKQQFGPSGPFTLLIVLVKIDRTTLWPLASSYVHVIGDELAWREMRDLLDRSGQRWDGAALFARGAETGGPLPDPDARAQLRDLQQRVIADHSAINEGVFFDRDGRSMKVEEIRH